jgi:hypothetical protein
MNFSGFRAAGLRIAPDAIGFFGPAARARLTTTLTTKGAHIGAKYNLRWT